MVADCRVRPPPASDTRHRIGCPLRPNGQESGPKYFRARFYDPTTGEFISKDPLEYVDGMSLYRGYFVPNRVDPYGSHWQIVGTNEDGENILQDLHTYKCYVRDDINGEEVAQYPYGKWRPVKCPPDRPIPPGEDVTKFNCSSLAFRDSFGKFIELAETKAILKDRCREVNCENDPNSDKVGRCDEGELKCSFWEFDAVRRAIGTVTVTDPITGEKKVLRHGEEIDRIKTFHLVCSKVGWCGRATIACSKNGPGDIDTYAGPDPLDHFEPEPGGRVSPSEFRSIENMKRTCYCCADKNGGNKDGQKKR